MFQLTCQEAKDVRVKGDVIALIALLEVRLITPDWLALAAQRHQVTLGAAGA